MDLSALEHEPVLDFEQQEGEEDEALNIQEVLFNSQLAISNVLDSARAKSTVVNYSKYVKGIEHSSIIDNQQSVAEVLIVDCSARRIQRDRNKRFD